jgi:hypothetical protein
MRVVIAGFLSLLLTAYSGAKEKTEELGKAVTVSAGIDHNRLIIPVEIQLPNGSRQTVRGWVDNGNPELCLSRRLATMLGLDVKCGDTECSAPAPSEIIVGGMSMPLNAVKEAKIPLRPPDQAAVLAPGMDAEINLPSSILRNYDVLVDFVARRFSIGAPGTIHFEGSAGKMQVNAENGLIQVPSQIEGKKYSLALDLGSSISSLSEDLFGKLATEHPDWPLMTGAAGPANMWGNPEETKWKIMRVDRMQFGSLFLTNVPTVSRSKTTLEFFEKRAAMPTVGLIGSNVMLNYRVGLDYAHSTVYFDLGRTYKFPDFDVIGLTLRPEGDGRFTILDSPEFEGKPSVSGVQPGDHLVAVNDLTVTGATMGQVWSMLAGKPGDGKKLTIERTGKEFSVLATVRHFLPDVPDETARKKKK